jgi:hypothetical protein
LNGLLSLEGVTNLIKSFMHSLIFSLICLTAFTLVHSELLFEDPSDASSVDQSRDEHMQKNEDPFDEVFADSLESTHERLHPIVVELEQHEELIYEEISFPAEPALVKKNAQHGQQRSNETRFLSLVPESEENFQNPKELQYDESEFNPDIETEVPSLSDDVDLDEPEPPPPEQPRPLIEPESNRPEYIPSSPPSSQSPLPQELVIDLKNPVFIHGVITTEEGGVISGQGIRIQARKIEYANKIENGIRIQKIVAEEDLMMEYANRAFVGSRLEYDFINKTGVLYNGKTFVDIWFLGGDKIELQEDGTFYISNAFVTTCEDQDNTWEINAKTVKITEDKFLAARNIRFRFFKVPLFWLPSFKSNLKAFSDPPIRYKLVWDKGLGPRLTMRYRIFSWRDLNLFFRLDYRLKRGFGGAFESEYSSPDHATTFVTRSYGAHDKSFPDEKGPHRYRLQGLYHTQSKDEKSQIHLTWDKLSDTRMVGDFRSDDFEINTQKRTHLVVFHQLNSAIFNLSFQPRVNRFDSIDQELPLLTIGVRPFQLGNSGIISNNDVNAGYLDYVYANDLRKEFHRRGLSSSTRAVRMETRNELYRPFSLGHFTLTPNIGVIGIFYSNNPSHHPISQGIFSYGFTGQTRLFKNYKQFRHMSEPYLEFQGLTSPTAALSHHFYFDINDGYDELNQLRIGWRNSLYSYNRPSFLPSIFTDIYTYGFFGNRDFAQTFPKFYLNVGWNRPSYAIRGGIAWNHEEQVWDFTNIATDWTINEDIAFGIEFRHRSKFDWRKADHENFIVDVARPIPELLKSPLSDGRDTLLTRFFIRLAPKWSCQIQSRHGWGRKNEPRYNAGKIDLITMLTCSWRLRLSYERLPNDNRFSGSVSLVK